MADQRITSRAQWLAARRELLEKEKAFTRQRDALSAARRALPMVEVEKNYVFDGPQGLMDLRELFDGRRQLIVYHFMFDPSWDEGCKSCSYFADNVAGSIVHLHARDTSFAAVSRAPLGKIESFKNRMGWRFPWVCSLHNDFNYDFHVTLDERAGSVEYNFTSAAALREAGKIWMNELPGLSIFLRDGDRIFHTYSTYARGLDPLINTYNFLDLTPLGRQEDDGIMAWVRHHDKYASAAGLANEVSLTS